MNSRTMHSLVAATVSAMMTVSCHGSIGEPGGVPSDSGMPGTTTCAVNNNDSVRMRLAPTCLSCHGERNARPFFATLSAFEDLLVYNPAYVVRGNPDASPLVALLEGHGTGAYRQMPLAGDAFATRANRGETQITMAEIRAWITELPPPDPAREGPDPDAPTTRRLTADEVINAIEVALGQEPHGGVPPLIAVNGPQPLSPDSPAVVDYNDANRRQAYLMLGGPGYLAQRRAEPAWSPSSLITLTQIAQGACSLAVANNNPHIFHDVMPSERLPAAEAHARANIAYLYRRFLGEAAPPAAVDALFTRVYAPAEATSPQVAWTQVCTALVRDPMFITF